MPWSLLAHMLEEYSSMMNTDEKKDEISLDGNVNIEGLKINV